MLSSTVKAEKGFTIMEIMVAIAILAIITAIAVPTFLNQRKKGYDSALRADMTTVGTAVAAWSASHSWDELRTLSRNAGYETVATPSSEMSGARWNAIAANPANGLPKLDIDPNMQITVVYKTNAALSTAGWTHNHAQGNFCVTGFNAKSNYPGTGGNGASLYDKLMFWDQEAGPAVFTMDELMQIRNNGSGTPLSCSGWVNYHKTATGK